MHTVLQMVLYALIAAASPFALTATVAVLKSHLARLNGLIFAGAFVLGEGIGWIFALALGSVLGIGTGDHKVAAAFELALGVLLLLTALQVHRGVIAGGPQGSSRATALLGRLEHLRPFTAFWIGTLLGIGIPKRLTITIVAAAALKAAGFGPVENLLLILVYMATAAVLVWVPVAIYVVAGPRADNLLDSGQEWLASNQRPVTLYSLLVFGALLVFDGLIKL